MNLPPRFARHTIQSSATVLHGAVDGQLREWESLR